MVIIGYQKVIVWLIANWTLFIPVSMQLRYCYNCAINDIRIWLGTDRNNRNTTDCATINALRIISAFYSGKFVYVSNTVLTR